MKRPFKFSSPGFNTTLDRVQNDQHIPLGSPDDMQRFWYCPKDRTELNVVPNPISTNPYYIIKKNNLDKSIMDGIASKRFPSDLYFAVKILAEHIFAHSNLKEISIANTSCPVCKLSLCSPKL